MIQSKWFLCAQNIVVDRRNSMISVINLLENLQVPLFPAVIPMDVVIRIEKSVGDAVNYKMKLEGKIENDIIFTQDVDIIFLEDNAISKHVVELKNVVLTKPGRFVMELLDEENRIVSSYDFFIKSKQLNTPIGTGTD